MTPGEISSILHQLCDAAALETLPRFRTGLGVDNKDMQAFDPVTEADRQAELAIRNLLTEKHPDHGITGEEFGSVNEDARFRWIVDPVDGTRAFIAGIPVWGTLIGLYENGKPLAGIMNQPFTGERYLSDGQISVFEHNGRTQTLQTSQVTELSDVIIMTTAPELFNERDAECFNRVAQSCRLVRYGADCYAYAQLAAGHLGLVIETGLNVYDIAALIPIIENAGGTITGWQGESASSGGRIVAAANRSLHERALDLLNA